MARFTSRALSEDDLHTSLGLCLVIEELRFPQREPSEMCNMLKTHHWSTFRNVTIGLKGQNFVNHDRLEALHSQVHFLTLVWSCERFGF